MVGFHSPDGEHVASNLVDLVLFVPFFFLVLLGDGGKVWHWMDPAHVNPIIEGKSGFLNVPFWTAGLCLLCGVLRGVQVLRGQLGGPRRQR